MLASSGRPLDNGVRHEAERRFGTDFSTVRVHDDVAADRAARSVSARAFVAGERVVFAAGQHDPRGAAGRHLLAHELSHVVQQRRSGEAPAAQLEHHARDAADRFTASDAPVAVAGRGCPSTGLAREIDRDALARDIRRIVDILDYSWISDSDETTIVDIIEAHSQTAEEMDAMLSGIAVRHRTTGALGATYENYATVLFAEIEGERALRLAQLVYHRSAAYGHAAPGSHIDRAEAGRTSFQHDMATLQRGPGLLGVMSPALAGAYQPPVRERIQDPVLRQAAGVQQQAVQAVHQATRDIAVAGAVTYGAGMILATAGVFVAEGGGVAGACQLAGRVLQIARGGLVRAGTSAVSYYLSNPIFVNELGVIAAGLVVSCEGNLVGLLHALAAHPEQAAVILGEVLILHAQVGPTGSRPRNATLEVRIEPPAQQTTPNRIRLRVVSATVEPAAEVPHGAPVQGARAQQLIRPQVAANDTHPDPLPVAAGAEHLSQPASTTPRVVTPATTPRAVRRTPGLRASADRPPRPSAPPPPAHTEPADTGTPTRPANPGVRAPSGLSASAHAELEGDFGPEAVTWATSELTGAEAREFLRAIGPRQTAAVRNLSPRTVQRALANLDPDVDDLARVAGVHRRELLLEAASVEDRAVLDEIAGQLASGGDSARRANRFLTCVVALRAAGSRVRPWTMRGLRDAYASGDALLGMSSVDEPTLIADLVRDARFENGRIVAHWEVGKLMYYERFDFVIIEGPSGFTVVVGSAHSGLAGGRPNVYGAGRLHIDVDGNVLAVDNWSGHYQPTMENLRRAIPILRRYGFLPTTFEIREAAGP